MNKPSLWAAVAFVLVLGCAHPSSKKDKASTRCVESRNLVCLTGVECAMDRERGCQVCQCEKAVGASEHESGLPSGLPPDRRPNNP